MRVVAGLARGIPLQLPMHDLRPTMDKVKAAIFSSLADRVPEARVLDLFAGSGALGIEALSRGANSATLVDHHAKASDAMRFNLQKTRLTATVHREEVFHFLKRNTAVFDLIFADPPYGKSADATDFAGQLLQSPDLARALAPEGIFILERHPAPPPAATALFTLLRQKSYGASEVLFLSHPPSPLAAA